MATAVKRQRRGVAMENPWVYDEHIAAKDNTKGITEVMNWLPRQPDSCFASSAAGATADFKNGKWVHQAVLPNGRAVCHSHAFTASASKALGVVYINGSSGQGRGTDYGRTLVGIPVSLNVVPAARNRRSAI